jgi:hypothetical protein
MLKRLTTLVQSCDECPYKFWSYLIHQEVCRNKIEGLSAKPIEPEDIRSFPAWCPLPDDLSQQQMITDPKVESRLIHIRR